jgi:hypothetical protein
MLIAAQLKAACLQWQQQQAAFSYVNCCVADNSLVAMAAQGL